MNSRRTGSENERIVFYADDNDSYHHHHHHHNPLPDYRQQFVSHGLYPPSPHERARRSNSVCLQSERPRRLRHSIDTSTSGRRYSVHASRTRSDSYTRPTPLGIE